VSADADDDPRVAVTGTPGTGKTTATTLLDDSVIHLNELIREAGLWTERDTDRDSLVADLDAVREAHRTSTPGRATCWITYWIATPTSSSWWA